MRATSRWDDVLRADLAVPPDLALGDAATELTVLLGSTDPHLRNDVATTLLCSWVEAGTFDDLLIALGDGMCAGLRHGLGGPGGRAGLPDDSVFRRSASALVLAAVVERDNAVRVLHPAPVLVWADAALHWFVHERDLRGWTGETGWSYAVAHGADLVAALALSRHVEGDALAVLLDAVADRLARSAWDHLVDGEPDRLAYAVMMVLHRDALLPAQLLTWLERSARPLQLDLTGPYAAAHANTLAFARALHLMLRFGVSGRMPWHRGSPAPFEPEPAGRIELLHGVEEILRGYHPGLYGHGRDLPDDA